MYMENYRGSNQIFCNCLCSCGNKKNHVLLYNIIRESVKSCGCRRRNEAIKNLVNRPERFTANNHSQDRIYMVWQDMKRRCYNRNRPNYPLYGGRGIKVCNEWLNFNNFYEWAIKNGYNDSLTIERRDNEKNYCPENCHWIPKNEQARNMRTNNLLTANGETHPLNTWVNITGIPNTTIRWRLMSGWSIDEALGFKERTK